MNKSLWTTRVLGIRAGLLLNAGSLWVGAHYSAFNRRLCINIVPCLTLWVVLPGGTLPSVDKA